MNLKFEPVTAIWTAGLAAAILFVGGHIAGIRNPQFGIAHEVLDLFGNVSKSVLTGDYEFDWGEWEPVDGEETETTELTPEQIEQFIERELSQ